MRPDLTAVLSNARLTSGGKQGLVTESEDKLRSNKVDPLVKVLSTGLDVEVRSILVKGPALQRLSPEDVSWVKPHVPKLKLDVFLVCLRVGHLADDHNLRRRRAE